MSSKDVSDTGIAESEYAGSRIEQSNREVAELANRGYKYGWET